jgi:hypothetical protein
VSSNGAGSKSRASGARAKQSNRRTAGRGTASRRTQSQSSDGVVGTLKSAAGKAGAPAMAVGAAAAGVLGGLAIKGRSRRRKLHGLRLPEVDLKAVAKTVGKASKQLGERSKNVSKDLERMGDQAERVGKILD